MTAASTSSAIDTPWLLTREAAPYARCGEDEIRDALASGELRGSQRRPGGRWRIHRDDLDAWLRGERQPTRVPAVTRRHGTDNRTSTETENGAG